MNLNSIMVKHRKVHLMGGIWGGGTGEYDIFTRSTRGVTVRRAPYWADTGGADGQSEREEQGKGQENKSKQGARVGATLQYNHGMFRFTFAHHPVPIRSLLNSRLGPDDNVGHESRRISKMFLGSGFEAGLAAWQTSKRALYY